MNSVSIGALVFACTFGGALAGIWLRAVLMDYHLSDASKDTVKVGIGLLATMTALGLACLKAREDVRSPAGLAVTYGITSYNVLAAVVFFWAITSMVLPSPILWAAAIGHALFSALFVHALVVFTEPQSTIADHSVRMDTKR